MSPLDAERRTNVSPAFMRHMHEYGTRLEQVATVKAIHSEHASNNPKAYYQERLTAADVLASRIICKPLYLLDCCVEADNGNAIIVTTADHAARRSAAASPNLRVVGRCSKPRLDMHYQHGPISAVAGRYAREILWPNSGIGPEEVDAPARMMPSPSQRCCNSKITVFAKRVKAAPMSATVLFGWAAGAPTTRAAVISARDIRTASGGPRFHS